MILAENKENIVKLYKNMNESNMNSLKDYISLCHDNNFKVEIPAGVNKLIKLHEDAVWEVNKINADNYSKEYRYDIEEDFTKNWKEKGLIFRRPKTPYEMYCQGLKQHHCIGTNYAKYLHAYAFYTFSFKGREYDLQLHTDGRISQFYGYRNSPVPDELRKIVQSTNTDNSFKITDLKPGLDNYPLLNPSLTTNNIW